MSETPIYDIESQVETEASIERLRALDAQTAAAILDARAVSIVRRQERSFIELGMICAEMDERGLYASLMHPTTGQPYHSWAEWATTRLGESRSRAFAARAIYRQTRGNVALEDLQEMSRQNLVQLAKLSPAVQREVVEAAKTQTEDEFIRHVQEVAPDQHLTMPARLVLRWEDEAYKQEFEQLIEMAKVLYRVGSAEDALFAVSQYFRQSPCEREDYADVSNEEAYEILK